jgi:hypothetical protein
MCKQVKFLNTAHIWDNNDIDQQYINFDVTAYAPAVHCGVW